MLSFTLKSAVALCALVLVSSTYADSPVTLKKKSSNAVQRSVSSSGFIYPESSLQASDFIETGVLFVYNEHILDYFNGDTEKLISYIDANIEYNNQAFVNSNIPIKRVVSGLVYLSADETWSSSDTYTDRLHALSAWQSSDAGRKLKRLHKYSYLVSLAGYDALPNEEAMLGQAFIGDSVSWISPFNTNPSLWLERTLAHELSHSDGFKHQSSGHPDGGEHIARYDAAGYQCGSHGSIMFIFGERTEPFFSDADISIEENQKTSKCGAVGEANAAQVYRDLVKTTFANSKSTFSNVQATRKPKGLVAIHESVSAVREGDSIEFDIVFEGGNVGDSVNYIVRQGTAGLDDYSSTIGMVVHNGIDNVYAITMPTYSDKNVEPVEYFSYELVYPNGVSINKAHASIEASIYDADGHNGESGESGEYGTNGDAGYVEIPKSELDDANLDNANPDNINLNNPNSANTDPINTAPSINTNNSASLSSNAKSSSSGGGSVSIFYIFLLLSVLKIRQRRSS